MVLVSGKGRVKNRYIVRIKIAPLLFIARIIVFLSLAVAVPCFAGEVKNSKNISEDELIPLEKVEVLSVDFRDKAEAMAKTLQDSGYRPIVTTEDVGGKRVYKVYILIDQKDQGVPTSDELSKGPAANKSAQDEAPGGYNKSDNKPSWGVLGRQNKLVHGSLTLEGIYTDNILNSRDNKISDFSTFLSPAIWLLLPHSDKNIASSALVVRSPGGSLVSRQWPDSASRYLASLYYRADIPLTSSSGHLLYGTTPAQTVSGRLLIKGNRFSLLAEDQYEFSYHEQETGAIIGSGGADRYHSNYFGVTALYDTRHRLVLSGGYSNYTTKYISDVSDFRNRQDNSLFGNLSYKLTPRLSLLAEYRFFDISYDHNGTLDSTEHYFMGGISWDITAKSKGLFKAGYVIKEFDHSVGSFNDFSLELQLDHRFTPKTSVVARAYRKPNETDLNGTAFSLTNGFDVNLRHVLTPKLTSTAGFMVEDDNYRKLDELTEAADSTTYQLNAGLQYAFKRWLKGAVGYAYTVKTASIEDLEFNSNTLFFNVTASF